MSEQATKGHGPELSGRLEPVGTRILQLIELGYQSFEA